MAVLVFDLDGTLCPSASPIKNENIQKLIKLEEKGHQIVICSGKPTFYLQGMFRQVGLDHPILIGEMGACIDIGKSFPPEKSLVLYEDNKVIGKLKLLGKKMKEKYKENIWIQPGEVELTLAPRNKETYDAIKKDLDKEILEDIDLYVYKYDFDLLPKGINKAYGIKRLAELMNVSPEDMYGTGDSINDYPMFDFVGHPLGINLKEDSRVEKNFLSIDEALDFLLKSL